MGRPKKVIEEITEVLEPVLLDSSLTDGECDDDCTYKGLKAVADKLDEIIEKLTQPVIKLYQSLGNNTDGAVSQKIITDELNKKQPLLECGVSIKTINGECLLGAGDIEIEVEADCPWRVGDVLPSFSSENPSATWAGTSWELACKGKAIVGVDPDDATYATVGATYGEKAHAITWNEMPSHAHGPYNASYPNFMYSDVDIQVNGTGRKLPASGGSTYFVHSDRASHIYDKVASTGYAGGSQAMSMHQPSINLYIWRRTA